MFCHMCLLSIIILFMEVWACKAEGADVELALKANEAINRKKMIKKTLVAGLFFMALGGWLLHLRIHPPVKDADFLIPYISGIVSVFCLPLLFWFRRTAALAYVINGFLVITGTITMEHFSIANFQGPISALNIIV